MSRRRQPFTPAMTVEETLDMVAMALGAPPNSGHSKNVLRHVAKVLANPMGRPDAKWLTAEQSAARQANVVKMIFSGSRVSLSRAWKLCNYAKHNPSFTTWLRSPAIRGLIREQILDGRPLPTKYAERILTGLNMTEADVAALREQGAEERALGIR